MKTVTLQNPIPYGDGTLSEITLREPKAGELRGIGLRPLMMDMEPEAMMMLLPRISSPLVTKEQAAHLSMRDITTIFGAIAGFLGDMENSPKTSEPPLP